MKTANTLRALRAEGRGYLAYAVFFSVFVNLALLLPMVYMMQVFDRVLTSRSLETLTMLTLLTLVGLGMMFLLDFVRVRLLQVAAEQLDRRLGTEVLGSLIESASQVRGARYVHGLRDVAALRGFLGGPGLIALLDAPWLPVFIVVIWLFDPLLGALALAGAALLFLLTLANEWLNRKPLEEMQDGGRRAGRFIDSGLRNADVLNGMGMTGAFTSRWAAINERVLATGRRTSKSMSFIAAFGKFLRQFIYIVMLGTGAYLVIEQNVSSGVMMAASILLSRALAPMEALIGNWRGLVAARLAYRHLDQHLTEAARPGPVTTLPAPTGALRVENASLVGPDPERPILQQLNFALAPGESLAIIGPSAAGKSSLAKLLVGVWKPSLGHVRLDGADLSQWTREALGPYVGYLPQDVELLPGTVAENIARLGRPDDEAVVAAGQRAHVHELILKLPKGYDTPIGEGGLQLSAGQAQRVGLARALFGNPRLVVLDEPNANLDAEGEDALLRTLQTLRHEGVTTIMVTHRPSLVGSIDKVLVLAGGRIERIGPREEVLASLVKVAEQRPRPAGAVAVRASVGKD